MKRNFSKTMILIAVIFMDLLGGMEFDLFVPSFPELQSHFNLSPFWVEALLSANFLGYCLSLFFVGSLSDHYGRKPIILWGLTLFIIGSILCVGSTLYPFLLVGRFLQGLGIAAPVILSFLIITDTYSLKQQQFLLAMLNGVMNIAVAIAPVVGSYIALHFNWRVNFIALLALGIITGITTLAFVPKTQQQHLAETPNSGYMTIFRSRPLVLLIINLVFMFVPYWIFVGMSPLLYIKELKVSLSEFGYYQGILALVFAIGTFLFGFIVKRVDQKKTLKVSVGIYTMSLVLIGLTIFFNSTNPLWITLAFLTFIIGQIIPTTVLYPLCLNFLPSVKGRVSAIVQGLRLVLTAIGLQIAGYLYQGTFQNIGIVIISFILIGVVTLVMVIKNNALMRAFR
ncbi:MAG: multidrug effflux MFS transporter [Gammaproteobacteria bacterium]